MVICDFRHSRWRPDGDGAAYVFAGNADYTSTSTIWSTDFVNARGQSTDASDQPLNEGILDVDGLWHQTERRLDGLNHSGASFYYGRESQGDYDAGTNSGSLITRDIDLRGQSTEQEVYVSFSYLLQTENQPLKLRSSQGLCDLY